MSTRCHIIVEHPEHRIRVILYRHSDGYPYGEHGVLATLAPFVARFMQHRGWDPCYLAAHIMADQIKQSREGSRSHYAQCLEQCGRKERDYYERQLAEVDDNFLGYGISNAPHGDVEFVYYVRRDGIHVQQVTEVRGPDVYGPEMTTPEEARALMTGEIPERFKEWPE